MTRVKSRRAAALRFDRLESRQLLTHGGPTAEAQYMLELINEARINPSAAADRVTTDLSANVKATLDYFNVDVQQAKQEIASTAAKPPLAWNEKLAAAAQAHSQDMADNQFQSHTGSDGSSSSDRISNAGYSDSSSTGENAYAYADSVDESMEAFLLDWGVADKGHRRNLLQADTSADSAYRDVGIGIVKTKSAGFGPYVITQDFGSQNNEKAELLGVAYSDQDHNDFYSVGEGQEGVRIDATNLSTGVTSSTETWDAGGYQMALDPGKYKVTASVNGKIVKSVNMNVGTQNVKQDFVLSDAWQGGSLTPAPTVASSPKPQQSVSVTSNNSPVTSTQTISSTPTVTKVYNANTTPTVATTTPTTTTPTTTTPTKTPVVSITPTATPVVIPTVSTVAPIRISSMSSWTSWKANRA